MEQFDHLEDDRKRSCVRVSYPLCYECIIHNNKSVQNAVKTNRPECILSRLQRDGTVVAL